VANSSPDAVFRARGLRKTYRTGEVEVQALRDVDLDVARGEFIVLLGPSGSGKSTLLNILGGLDVPSAGEVSFGDHRLSGASEAELTAYRREHVGFVFQFYNLIPSLTVRENVALVTDIVRNAMPVDEAVDRVGSRRARDRFYAEDRLETLVSEGFAQAHRLEPGATLRALINGKQRTLVVVGTALSPEYIFAGLWGMPDTRDITSPPELWRSLGDGFRVGVRLVTLAADDALRVPVSAVFPLPAEEGGMAVFVLESGRARMVPVEVAARNGSDAWVRRGIAAGTRVIVYPPAAVADGARVRERQVSAAR